MFKYLTLILLTTQISFASSQPGLAILKKLSEYGRTNNLQDRDLIAVSPQPGTGFEVPMGMQYGDIRTQLFINPVSQDLTNYFQGLRAPLWIRGIQGRTTLVYTNTQSVITLRQRGDSSDTSALWNRVIYFGGTSPSDVDAVSAQVYGGITAGQGNPRISLVLGDDQYTWRFREFNIEDGGLVDGTYHSILQHDNLGDVWLGGMGARNLTIISPGAIGNGNSVVITVDNTAQGLASYTFTAGTQFLTNGNSATVAASLATSISNAFTLIDWNYQLLVNYTPATTNIQIVPLTGTKNISITVPSGITYTATTNGTTTAMGVIIGDGSGITNLVAASNQVFVATGSGATIATNVVGSKVTYTVSATGTQSPTNIYGNGFNFGVMTAFSQGSNYVVNLTNSAYLSITNSLNSIVNFVHVTNGPGICYIRLKSPDINYFCYFPTNWAWISTNGLGLVGTTYTNYVQVSAHRTGLLTIQSWGGNNPTDVTAKFEVSAP